MGGVFETPCSETSKGGNPSEVVPGTMDFSAYCRSLDFANPANDDVVKLPAVRHAGQ